MRKVVLRWNITSIQGAKELSKILNICERIEVLAHLGVSPDGIVQLAEVKVKEGHDVHELSELDSFKVMDIHEENEDGVLISLLCTHTLAKSAIELSNLHLQCPYGIDAERGMEMRISGLTGAMRRFLALLRLILPPDKVSVSSMRNDVVNGWAELLTERQQERSEEHTSELQSQAYLVCRLLLEKKKTKTSHRNHSLTHRCAA